MQKKNLRVIFKNFPDEFQTDSYTVRKELSLLKKQREVKEIRFLKKVKM